MKVSSRTWRVVAAAGLVVGAVAVSSSAPQADTANPVTIQEPAGVLRLRLSNSGPFQTLTYTGPLAGIPASQTFTVDSKCGLSPANPAPTTPSPLMKLTTDPVTSFGAGLVSNGIGVRTKNNCSTDSGRITGTQSVTLALGSAFPTTVKIVGAELDIEGKGNAELEYRLDGRLGEADIVSASDNGPDSGINDNTRVIIDDTGFRSIALAPARDIGQISLEGGGDGTLAQYLAAGKVGPIGTTLDNGRGTTDTIFQLVSEQSFADIVECEETGYPASVLGGSATRAIIDRLPDADPSSCADLPVTFQILDDVVLLRKPTVEGVNLRVTIEWTPLPVGDPGLQRQIDLTPDSDETGFVPVVWCSGGSALEGYVHPAGVPWCLVSESFELQPGGQLVQTQVYDGAGDPMWK